MSNRKKVVFYASVVILIGWLMLIYTLSAQPAHRSDNLSKGVTRVIIEMVKETAVFSSVKHTDISMYVDKFNHIVRKNAHFTAYLLLGIFTVNVLRQRGHDMKVSMLCGMLFCIIYASSDEFHQLFVEGRGAQVTDVLIDSSGSLVGVCLYNIASKIRSKSKKSTNLI